MNNKKYDYWLACIDGIGDRTIRKLHDNIGDAEAIYYAGEEQIASLTDEKKAEKIICSRNSWNVDSQYQRCIDQGINFLTIDDEEYPDKLKCIPDPPYNIFYKGGLPDEKTKSVAIIGARECSEYGKYVSRTLAGYLGKYGVQIISGMARGVDGISQRAALEEGGTSFGVLGSGVDVCYPKQNRFLYDELIKKGGVISIYRPGVLPQPQNFPPRNRIVSGLADVIVVIDVTMVRLIQSSIKESA